ncbi:hypothetical protein LRP88_14898 [Fusarium phalaenopsidis]
MPTQHNSSLYEGSFPEVDAASVRTLRHAGALIFGKTTTAQFAAVHVGPETRNPHDPHRTPGGSSTGSGAVVADFQAPIALGIQDLLLTFDTLGWFARCVDDLALLADVFGIQDDKQEEDATVFEGVKGARFAICKTAVWPFAGPGTQGALSKAAALLEAHGAIVEEVDLPLEFDNLPEWHRVVLHCEGGTAFLPEYRVGKDDINQVLVDHVENINGFTRKEHLEALDGMAALRPKFDEIAGRYAVIITPSVPDEAPVGLESTGSHIFCCIWSASPSCPLSRLVADVDIGPAHTRAQRPRLQGCPRYAHWGIAGSATIP